MKKLFTRYVLIFFALAMVATSCSDGTIGDTFVEDQYVAKGALVSTSNVVNGFFDLVDPSNSAIAFDLSSEGEPVSNVNISVSLNGGGLVPFSSVSSLPVTVNAAMEDVLNLVGATVDDLEVGDQVDFFFDATSSSGTFRSSRVLNIPFSCLSKIGGTFDYVSTNFVAVTNSCPTDPVTGTVTWEDLGGGNYLSSDLGFGQYGSSCWNDSPATSSNATLTDQCNQLISGGRDQYGLTYIYEITGIDGPELRMSWSNDYGDSGDVVLTRQDGADWPPLFN